MKRAFQIVGLIIAAGLVCCLGHSLCLRLYPAAEFKQWTGRGLPEGFQIVRSRSAVTDNILRSSYYCALQMPAGTLHRLLDGTDFAPSVEAKEGCWQEVQTQIAPGLRAEDISEAYAWYPPGHQARFLLLDRTGTVAYYVVSTL